MEFRLCCASRHADGRAVAQLVSAVRAIRGGGVFCLGSGYRAEPASRGREGLLLYFGAVPNRERDFFLPESLHCWRNGVLVGRPGGRGSSWLELFGSRGRGAALVFRMVVRIRGSAFLFGVVSTPGKKCRVGTVV